jgi:Spy/CpxP family protein refolding chaperone
MKHKWIILLFGLLILSIASFAAARLVSGRMVQKSSAPCAGIAMLQDYLELMPDQRLAIADMDAKYRVSRPALRDRIWEARNELLGVLNDPDARKSDVLAAADNFNAAQQALQKNTIEYIFALREHLTPAQKQKLIGLMSRGICPLASQPGMGGRRGAGRGAFCGMGKCGNGFCR